MQETAQMSFAQKDSIFKKFFSVWVIVYVFVYIITSQFSPLVTYSFMENMVVGFGKAVFHLPDLHRINYTGSGDTTFDYVLVAFNVLLSFVLSLIIILADRKRKSYRQLYLFAVVIARYYVAYTMLVYGFAKIFHGQFGPLSYYSLEEKFGDMSPMGVLWNFMESSRVYSFFGGLVEVIGGLLLLFRKTKTFGALFSMTVMINVAILNFAYDVPVKLFSTHIVLLCVFILSYEWIKLYNFFIAHKPEVLSYRRLSVKKKWMKIVLISLKCLIIAYLLYLLFISRLFAPNRQETTPLEGVYTTRTFMLNRDTIPESNEDTLRWDKLMVSYPNWIIVQRPGDRRKGYKLKTDTLQKTMQLANESDEVYATFSYNLQQDTMILNGRIETDTARIILIRKQKKDYPLIRRGFHWINEYPYNR